MSWDFCFARVCVQIEFPKWIIPFCCVMVGGWWLPWEDSVILAGNEPDHEDLSVPRLHHCNPSCSIQHFPCLFFVKASWWRSPAALLCLWLAAALKKPDRVFWSSPFIAASSDEFSFCLWDEHHPAASDLSTSSIWWMPNLSSRPFRLQFAFILACLISTIMSMVHCCQSSWNLPKHVGDENRFCSWKRGREGMANEKRGARVIRGSSLARCCSWGEGWIEEG